MNEWMDEWEIRSKRGSYRKFLLADTNNVLLVLFKIKN